MYVSVGCTTHATFSLIYLYLHAGALYGWVERYSGQRDIKATKASKMDLKIDLISSIGALYCVGVKVDRVDLRDAPV